MEISDGKKQVCNLTYAEIREDLHTAVWRMVRYLLWMIPLVAVAIWRLVVLLQGGVICFPEELDTGLKVILTISVIPAYVVNGGLPVFWAVMLIRYLRMGAKLKKDGFFLIRDTLKNKRGLFFASFVSYLMPLGVTELLTFTEHGTVLAMRPAHEFCGLTQTPIPIRQSRTNFALADPGDNFYLASVDGKKILCVYNARYFHPEGEEPTKQEE